MVRRHSTGNDNKIAILWPPREMSPGCMEKVRSNEHMKGRGETASHVKPTILYAIQSEVLHHKILSEGVTYKYN